GIHTLLLDKTDRLWLSMDRGFVISSDRKSAKVLTPADGLPNTQVQVFAEDGEGAVWMAFGTRRNLAFIKDGHVTVLNEADGVPPGQSWIATDSKGALWLAKGGHLCVYRKGKLEEQTTFPQSQSVRIAACNKGGMWISSGSRLWKFEEGSKLQPAGE